MTAPRTVLFVCRHNAGRSQIAAGLLRAKGVPGVTVRSAGLDPAAEINRAGAAALLERGIDISDQVPRPVTAADLGAADVVVTLVEGVDLPPLPARTLHESWTFPDPAAWDLEHLRPLVDRIDARVTELAGRLTP